MTLYSSFYLTKMSLEERFQTAINNDDYDAIEQLIKEGFDINKADEDGQTLLMSAIEDSNLELAQLLIEHGADVNARDKDGKMPIHYAASSLSTDMVDLFYKSNIDINAKDNDGWTPLHCAADAHDFYMMRFLVEIYKADMKIANNKGQFPIDIYYYGDYPKWAKVMFFVKNC